MLSITRISLQFYDHQALCIKRSGFPPIPPHGKVIISLFRHPKTLDRRGGISRLANGFAVCRPNTCTHVNDFYFPPSLVSANYRICRRIGRSIFGRENIKKSGCGLCGERVKQFFFFFFLVSIYGAMPGNVSQLSNQCVGSPLGNYNNTKICLSSWFESNLSNRSQYVVYNNNSSIVCI